MTLRPHAHGDVELLRVPNLCTTLCLILLIIGCPALNAETPYRVSPPSKRIVADFHLSPFYKKSVNVMGFPIVGSEKVSDYALKEAGYIVSQMLAGRNDIRNALIKNRIRLAIMAYNELTTMIPEHSDLTPAKYWDKRARGLGATSERPAVSASEENLLEFKGDPYKGENILIHEFAHAIHLMGLNTVVLNFQSKLEKTYQSALQKGLWKGTYAATNVSEYWAEGVQSYFDCNQSPNHDHNGVNTREKLAQYDPDFAELIASVFPNKVWRYERPKLRKEESHLKGYEASESPRFRWDPELVAWYKEYIKTHKE